MRLGLFTAALLAAAWPVASFAQGAPTPQSAPQTGAQQTGAQHAGVKTLNIATGGAFTSLDPHFFNLGPNNTIANYVFSPLIGFDPVDKLIPELAVSWKPLGDGHDWEFKLREGVTFQDGTPFTAEDVVATFARVPDVLNSPSSFMFAVKPVTKLEVVDAHTLRMHTDNVMPLLPYNMPSVVIIPKADRNAKTEDFNSGKAAIGTGPYKVVSFSPGDRVVFARNPSYYGPAPNWDTVNYRLITNGASRTAALQAGDVDVIDSVATRDVETLKKNANLTVESSPSLRLIYIAVDSRRQFTPFVTGADGSKIENPLRDPRVRHALSFAINRDGIKSRIMDGFSAPTDQLMPEGASGYDPTIKVDPYDPAKAKALLAEAGYPNGFAITLNGPNDRYVNDGPIEEAIAQMWTRVGVKTQVGAMPAATFFGAANRDEFSAYMTGWATDTGEGSSPLNEILASSNPDKGRGRTLRVSHYANPEVDRVYEQSLQTLDTDKREALYREATRIGMADQGIIPLHHQIQIFAMRKGISHHGRVLERTYAWDFIEPGS